MSSASRPWLASYPPGVRSVVPEPPFRTIGEMAPFMAREHHDQIAFTCVLPNGMSGDLTFGDVDHLSDAFAVYLREVAGLKPGDRVALQVPNGLIYPIVTFGTFKAGCVLVNVNPLYTADEMAHLVADAKPSVLVIIDLFADKLDEALRAAPVPHVVIARAAELFPLVPRLVVGIVQKYVRRQVPPVPMAHVTAQEALALGLARLSDQVAGYLSAVTPDDLACLQYTGGTTGRSKGAMLTHRNILMNMAQVLEMVGAGLKSGTEVLLTALPLYHIFAFTCNLMVFFWLGGRNILIPNPRPLSNLQKAFENYPITWLTGVNTLFNGLLNEDWFKGSPPKALKGASAGGMSLHAAVAQRWHEVTGTTAIEGYGLTEASPVLTFNPFGRVKPDTIGIPIPSTDIKCVDDADQEVAIGMPGELVAKGPQVMTGYWNRPDETAAVLRDGWLHTGDVAVMDEEGYFKIVDRKKDMVLVSGFNVYPNEVEDCLAKLAGVREVAVIGVPDNDVGEAVKAFIVRKDPGLTVADVRAFCREHLTGYKVPKFVEFRDDLPKSNVGKILRKDLRAEELAKAH